MNLVTTSIIQQLQGKFHPDETTFIGVGGNSLGASLGSTQLEIQLRDGRCLVSKFHVVRNITNYCPSEASNCWEQLRGKLADEQYQRPGKIHLLLGVGCWIKIIQSEIIKSKDGHSLAHKTKLGYIILADHTDPYQVEQPYIGAVNRGASYQNLMKSIQKLWEVEEVPFTLKRSKEEERCEQIFTSQHTRDKFGRYIVKIPFSEEIHRLGKTKQIALQQFLSMERKMRKNDEFASKYRLFMSEYQALGHMEQHWDNTESGYYTPHHGVLSATKFRVVFNASAKSTTGVTLNDAQLVGERLQRDLVDILMSFRQFKYGITADIEKMYRQIWVHKDHQQYQKIFWRENEKEPLKVYKLKTVTYGHASAPHNAIRTLVQCAIDHEDQFPMGARLVRENFYVDDLLTGADSQEEVSYIKKELTNLLKLGGFPITKWKTNGQFQESIEFTDLEEEQSVLGLCWNLATDKLFFKLREQEAEDIIWTKRRILSKIGKMYDPNGYLGPVIIRGKMIIQELWRNAMNWDDEIKGDLKIKWKHFNNDLKNLKLISVNRWLGTATRDKIQIHGFCDASERGYGAVIYTRTRIGSSYQTEIVISKSKVAPLKVLTIPRLELCAANLLANLLQAILPNFQKDRPTIPVYCWSDSQTVLQWITKSADRLKTYVANRVANIQSITELFRMRWRWIAGEDNPADLISRGTTIIELAQETKWWRGPTWLYEIPLDWPVQPEFMETTELSDQIMDEVLKEIKFIHTIVPKPLQLMRGKFPFISAYGEWKTLKRVTIGIFRAVHNWKEVGKQRNNLDNQYLETRAVNFLLQEDQRLSFRAEIEAAKTGHSEVLAKQVITWDFDQHLLRIDGRIRSDNLTRNEQFPILLDGKGALAPLLVRDAHLINKGHNGTQWVLQYLRQNYWITGARRLVKSILIKCPICFRLRMKSSEQLMATLPTFRTTPSRAFSRVGIDFAGPVMLRSSLGRLPKLTKAWIAVFVCLATRAIHLELVSDISTQAFIAALRRLVSRRGMVSEIISDNATNFVGSSNYFKALRQQLEDDSAIITEDLNLRWRFTTPGAPHQGGIYEAAVKSIKYNLHRIIGDTTLTFEEYGTILCQVEALVNSRPIAPLTDDPTNLNALTPGHFLIGEALVRIPDETDFREIPENRLNRWQHLQRMTQHFWKRWHEEYLSTLISRNKWILQNRNLSVGDLVVLKDENIPPMKWKLARVQEVLPGSDGLVRSVIIRTSAGVYKRPIVKLGVLLQNEEQ